MKAILLGSIGVIVETSELQRQSYNEAFKYHGLDWYWNVANYCELLKKPGGLKRLNMFGGQLIDELRRGQPLRIGPAMIKMRRQ